MYAVLIILGVLMLAMGPRLAFLVAVILPAVSAITLAAYAMGGGTLHQMAVIGLVIALGILVDNAIVMIEEVQWQLNHGLKPLPAAVAAVKQLAKPLAAATGTTLAAFVPLVLAKGGVGDFTRAVPTMIMIAMSISYVFALTVTPMLGQRFLRPKFGKDGDAKIGTPERIGATIGKFGGHHPWVVVIIAACIVSAAGLYAAKNLESEFFPQADRNLVLIDISLSEGTAQRETERVTRILEQEVRALDDSRQIHGFVGNSGPRFYYNLLRLPEQPNRSRLVVETTGLEGNRRIISFVREYSATQLPQAEVIAKILSQGPPVDSPVEIRVYNTDPAALAEATEAVTNLIQTMPGTINVKHNLGLGAPQLRFHIDDARASEFGLTRSDVARALLGRSQGIRIGTYRASDDPVPILVRSLPGENFDPAELDSVLVFNDEGEGVPLSAVANSALSWEPGAIFTRDQQRYSTISGELDFGVVFSEVIGNLKPKLAALELPSGTKYEYGGEAEASGEANSAIATTAPFGVILLLMFLLWQFNSFRRVGIVLVTIPLAFAGVFPSLAALGIPFGFQPLLGSIALIGIVVNNAIVLIDVLDKNLLAGEPFLDSISNAVARRTRPILLTTATTIAGLLPLAFSNTTMWPPLAWPIIFGLLASTALTLFVVPALCRILLNRTDGNNAVKAAV
jgi:multidrug efflux pump subunit AcrB